MDVFTLVIVATISGEPKIVADWQPEAAPAYMTAQECNEYVAAYGGNHGIAACKRVEKLPNCNLERLSDGEEEYCLLVGGVDWARGRAAVSLGVSQ